MRHKIRAFGLTVLTLLTMASGLSATISYTPVQPNVDQNVAFTLVVGSIPVIVPSIAWEFGDGTTASSQKTVNKTYTASGQFLVRVTYNVMAIPGPYTETTSIVVVERRSIAYSPAAPQINQLVMFQANNFLSSSIRWDFGDGTGAVMGGASMSHAYAYPAVFLVRAWDLAGTSTVPISVSVTVGADFARRRIQALPASPVLGRPVTLTALNFFTSDIRWDFGDGQTLAGGPSVVHTFQAEGSYPVRAWDWGGVHGPPATLNLVVSDVSGPRAAFQISFLQLRFDDGKSYKVVPRDFRGLMAYADIKYEGTGVFRARWLVDDAPFRVTTRAMPFAEDMTLDSSGGLPGQAPGLPGFPANLPGMHEVSLEIIEPAADFIIPVIRYFVSADEAVTAPDLAAVPMEIDIERAAQGIGCRLEPGLLGTPAGRFIILNGVLSHGLQRVPVKLALLRIHLESELLDQQFLKDLKPGEGRTFGTSIFGASAENKWVYLTVYSLDRDKAELLYFLKVKLRAQGK